MAGRDIFSVLYSEYKGNAKRRGIPWALSKELFHKVIVQHCHYCGRPPTQTDRTRSKNNAKTVGIDRIDSSLGYEPKNVLPACFDCNQLKSHRDMDTFLDTLKRICDNAIAKKD